MATIPAYWQVWLPPSYCTSLHCLLPLPSLTDGITWTHPNYQGNRQKELTIVFPEVILSGRPYTRISGKQILTYMQSFSDPSRWTKNPIFLTLHRPSNSFLTVSQGLIFPGVCNCRATWSVYLKMNI